MRAGNESNGLKVNIMVNDMNPSLIAFWQYRSRSVMGRYTRPPYSSRLACTLARSAFRASAVHAW